MSDTIADDEFNDFLDQMERAPACAKLRKKRGKPEAKVQKQIVQWLLKQGVIVAVTDAGALARVGLGMACGIPTGWPDITGCTRTGRFLGVECKAAKGRQSAGQLLFQQRITENGGIYILARSLEEFLEKFTLIS